MPTVKDETLCSSSSTDEQPSSLHDEDDDYSKCAKREKEPLVFDASSRPPADISCEMERSEDVLSGVDAERGSDDCPQTALLACDISDTSDSESGQHVTVHVGERDVDDVAEDEHVDEDHNDSDNQENDDVYQAASDISSAANTPSYMFAHMLDVDNSESPDNDMVTSLSEPTCDSVSTTGSYWRAQTLPNAAADSSGSGGANVDQNLDGNSDEPTTIADGLRSPESEDGYCSVEFFTNLDRHDKAA